MLASSHGESSGGEWSCYEDDDSGTRLPCPTLDGHIATVDRPHGDGGCAALQSLRTAYAKVRLIKRGSQGVVYLAQDRPVHATVVAIKRLTCGFRQYREKGVSSGALREIHVLFEIIPPHPNIVRVLNVVEAPHRELCLVLEYCPMDLERLVVSNRVRLSLPVIKRVLHSVLLALSHAHRHGVWHRDVKFSNILLSTDGATKLSDFGSARWHPAARPGALGYLTPAARCTTLLYRAPEMLLGGDTYDGRCDAWAAGVVFAEMVIGCHLFPGRGELDVLNRIWQLLGTPTDESWPEYRHLPVCQNFSFVPIAPGALAGRVESSISRQGLSLLSGLLTANPHRRLTVDEALAHPFFVAEQPAAASIDDVRAAAESAASTRAPTPPLSTRALPAASSFGGGVATMPAAVIGLFDRWRDMEDSDDEPRIED